MQHASLRSEHVRRDIGTNHATNPRSVPHYKGYMTEITEGVGVIIVLGFSVLSFLAICLFTVLCGLLIRKFSN